MSGYIFADNSYMPYIDTQMLIKKDDLVVKGEEVFVKKLTFTYKDTSGRDARDEGFRAKRW